MREIDAFLAAMASAGFLRDVREDFAKRLEDVTEELGERDVASASEKLSEALEEVSELPDSEGRERLVELLIELAALIGAS
jgi:hypothetical protein